MVNDGSRGQRQLIEGNRFTHGLDRGIQRAVLAKRAAEDDDFFLRIGIGLAQCFGISDPVQMAHRRPGAREAIIELLADTDDIVEIAWRRRGEQGVDAGLVIGQDRVDRGFDMLRADGREAWQVSGFE